METLLEIEEAIERGAFVSRAEAARGGTVDDDKAHIIADMVDNKKEAEAMAARVLRRPRRRAAETR